MTEIQITGVHYDVSDKLKSYIQEKFGALERFATDLGHVQVTVREEAKHGYRIDVDLHLSQHREVVAHDSEETVYAAVDGAVDKCAAQLRRIHGKRSDHRSDRLSASS